MPTQVRRAAANTMKCFHYLRYIPIRSSGHNDQTSELIRNFKSGDPAAIARCTGFLVRAVGRISLDPDTLVLVAPSSSGRPGSVHTAAFSVITAYGFADGTHMLTKRYPTKSFCRGGVRCATTLAASIFVSPAVTSRHILLLDDVTTTGTTFTTLSRLLLASGASSVSCLALARTVPRT